MRNFLPIPNNFLEVRRVVILNILKYPEFLIHLLPHSYPKQMMSLASLKTLWNYSYVKYRCPRESR